MSSTTDLAHHVDRKRDVMRHDTQRRRSARPRLMTKLTTGERLDHEVEFIVRRGLLPAAA